MPLEASEPGRDKKRGWKLKHTRPGWPQKRDDGKDCGFCVTGEGRQAGKCVGSLWRLSVDIFYFFRAQAATSLIR